MDDLTATFHRLRPRLLGIAYRMLGVVAEAEDAVQDAWLRWHGTNRDEVENAEAWLVAVTTRIAIDRLRAAKIQREHYTGIWLPEPLLDASPPTPEEIHERADDLSVAFLRVLERLTPEARAAFLLRDVFDVDYGEIAAIVGKSEAACRQIVSRARTQVRDERPRFAVPREVQHKLLQAFAHAVEAGDFTALSGMLAPDAELMGDGGGKVRSIPKPLLGARRIAQLFYAGHRRFGAAARVELVRLNGEWALLRYVDGLLESAQSYETDGERILRVLVQRNPDKLARIAASHGAGLAH
ncbi:RNA polymerase sigma-70 factor [Cupriavidus plantarum]|uniref:RNA polymerase sigma-70 factor n=1 Tax=Cupriavidus plantarum TaxID=942865 RepID=UPI000EAE5AE4|nr:RNA polymerase sigma-70 factor [Cupriavidus plantarum]RLK38965.1 RNA polymerase sigma-70 factor (ECF subfamily) [Cupriavidus plantarum]